MAFLYQDLDGARKYGGLKTLPEYVEKNLHFKLREYQRQAFENFITHIESEACPHPTQVLFHMATGSGKTLIMAGLIIYLYKRGYRNFLFFVNLSNIVDKTRDNFLNAKSKKYLFADEINLDGERIRVNVVENFQQADADAINICFTTTQALHMMMNVAKENGMTLDDFSERKTVLISDEAHHLNVVTKKKLTSSESEHRETWEDTVEKIFRMNAENILLEFTATCDIDNPSIKAKYEDKIVFDYPLTKFYNDRYSKEIFTFRSSSPLWDRVLQALVLSQYRLKIFADNRLSVKPVVLFKSAKINDSKEFMKNFIVDVKNLRGEKLRELSEKNRDEIICQAFKYFADKGITFDALADELREGFSEEHCISANDDTDATANQNDLNSLEVNQYRAVFEVRKLDEGWDVLNLFDIVRLYETRQSGGKKISPATIAEAQLIGRGARYCPFEYKNEPQDKRKFDGDVAKDLRICETLYYHCQNDHRYIDELHKALREIGLEVDRETREYKLKESFKREKIYTHGIIFINDREEINREFGEIISEKIYTFRKISAVGRDKVMSAAVESVEHENKFHATRKTFADIAEINYALVHKALRKFPAYKFDALKNRFPNLKSTREFITDEKYLGAIAVDIVSNELQPSIETLYAAAVYVLGKIAAELNKPAVTYRGTTEFFARNIRDIFRKNKIISSSETKMDLSKADWFAYEENFGTSEEKNFIKYFAERVDELKKIYGKIYLVRNEREFAIFSFDDGKRFEPDFVLFLQKKNSDELDFLQIFIEPKGEHLIAHDLWKENFLHELEGKAIPAKKILGLPFFNSGKLPEFDSAFRATLKL